VEPVFRPKYFRNLHLDPPRRAEQRQQDQHALVRVVTASAMEGAASPLPRSPAPDHQPANGEARDRCKGANGPGREQRHYFRHINLNSRAARWLSDPQCWLRVAAMRTRPTISGRVQKSWPLHQSCVAQRAFDEVRSFTHVRAIAGLKGAKQDRFDHCSFGSEPHRDQSSRFAKGTQFGPVTERDATAQQSIWH
jgi:hypothetical protein